MSEHLNHRATAALLVAILADRTRQHFAAHSAGSSLAIIALAATSIGLAAGGAGAAQMGWVVHEGERGLVAPAWNVLDTVPFASFMGLGLAAGCCAAAGLRSKVVPRWLAILSTFTAVVSFGLSIASLPFLTFAPGALWLVGLGAVIRPPRS